MRWLKTEGVLDCGRRFPCPFLRVDLRDGGDRRHFSPLLHSLPFEPSRHLS